MADETTRVATPEEVQSFMEIGRALGGLPAEGEPLPLSEALGRAWDRRLTSAKERMPTRAQHSEAS